MLNTPVAFIVFNRPDLTRLTFEAIRKQQPAQLFLIADGQRSGHPSDAVQCTEVRKIVERIDWPCEVRFNYSERNLGCKDRVVTGLDWVFSQVEQAIILEDDCLPHPDFFKFSVTLLERYRDDTRVMTITGNNFQDGHQHGEASYYFSKYVHVWGWATWRRAWQMNDLKVTFWPNWKVSKAWTKSMPDRLEREHWADVFNRAYRGELTTWDHQWTASVWYQGGLTATPNVNLVTNIGIGPDATHTVQSNILLTIPSKALGVLEHPKAVKVNLKADRYVFDQYYGGNIRRLRCRINRLYARAMRYVRRVYD